VNVLGLDTSTAATAACLLRADGRAFEVVPVPAALTDRPEHARELMPAVARTLEDAGLGFADLDAVAVGNGPGTFTGLRIGIATARAIAAARDLPVHPVSSLAALAAGVASEPALAVIDARRGEVFAALYEHGRGLWPAFVAAPAALAERVHGSGLEPRAVGGGAVRFRVELEAAGVRVPPDDSPSHVVRALHVCRLGLSVPPAPPEAILPDYLRMPDAVPKPETVSA
jgi:tRNA threonylcarbamoyladenosine biosynthesis protein TsaB